MKKVFLSLIVLLVLTLITPINLYATTMDENVLQISNTGYGVLRGEEFETTIFIEEGSNVTGLSITLTFDNKLVQLVSYEKLDALAINIKENIIVITFVSSKNVSEKLELLKLKFKVDEEIGTGKYTDWLYWSKGVNDEAFTTLNFDGGKPNYLDLEVKTSFVPLNIRTKGDVYDNDGDGKITVKDVAYLLQYVNNMFELDELEKFYANIFEDYDENNNPIIDEKDILLILEYIGHTDVIIVDRYEVVFYVLSDENEYIEYTKKSVKKDSELINVPQLDKGIWSLSSEEYIKVDFSKVTNNMEIYAYYGEVHIHEEVIDPRVEPTCTKAGLTEGSHCSTCNEIIVEQKEIPALDHDKIYTVREEATCDKTGTYYVTCSRCSYITYEEISVKPHDENTYSKEATCTESGHFYVTCRNCSYAVYEKIEAFGHNEESVEGLEPTCETAGYKAYIRCTRCDYSTYEEIKALGHSRVYYKKEATCTTTGSNTITCTRCDYKQTEKIPAKGHTEVIDPKVEATCTTTGLSEGKHCSVCKEILVKQQIIDKIEHNYIDGICNVCNKSINYTQLTKTVVEDSYDDRGCVVNINSNIIANIEKEKRVMMC